MYSRTLLILRCKLLVNCNCTFQKYCKEIHDLSRDFDDDHFDHDNKNTILNYVWIIICIHIL